MFHITHPRFYGHTHTHIETGGGWGGGTSLLASGLCLSPFHSMSGFGGQAVVAGGENGERRYLQERHWARALDEAWMVYERRFQPREERL